MNWNDLKVFFAIAETGSLSQAAKQLGVNHSTAFRRLKALEADMAVRLFDRLDGRYLLTPAGERMRELVRETDESVQRIEREVAGQDVQPSGKVVITTAVNIARVLLPDIIAGLRQSHPAIVVELAVGDNDYDLSRREADIALRATTAPPDQLVGRKLMELSWWVCGLASEQLPVVKQQAPLRGRQFIGGDSSMMRLPAFRWLESNFGDDIVCRANDFNTMVALVLSGVGLAVLPSDQNDSRLQRLYQIPDLSGELWLLCHPDLRRQRRVQVVWEAIVNGLCEEVLS